MVASGDGIPGRGRSACCANEPQATRSRIQARQRVAFADAADETHQTKAVKPHNAEV